MLLHVCAEINFKELIVSNMTFATPSNGMEVVLSHPGASPPTFLASLICQTLLMTKEQDHLSIRLKYLSIQMVGKTLATHMLSGNFATNRVTTLNNKENSINPLAFLPQRNACMVKQMTMHDMIANMEKSMDVLDAHKSKAKTSITQIGTMVSVVNFFSLCINMDSIIMATTTADSPPSILHQFLMKFIRIINSTEWAQWYNLTHAHMQLFHWHCNSFLKRVFNHIANFATNFGNVNITPKNQPMLEPNIQPLIHAITTMRAFKVNIILHHSLGMLSITMASSIEAYTLTPWKKMNSCNNACPVAPHQSNIPGPKPVPSNGNKVPCTSAGDKHNTTTPESGSKPTPVQCQKKQPRVVTNNTVNHAQPDMGMFWLTSPKMKMNKIFPYYLHEKVCIQFCCRGQEWKRDPDVICPFLHPRSSEDLKLETIELIRDHFLANKVGWFNEYHFLNLPGLKPKYKALLGRKD